MEKSKTALVLSSGALFCSYQAGAYRAIAERIQPDLVVGASAGALNGWPISGGCSPEVLADRWLDPAYSDVLRLVPNAGFRNGWFDPEPLRVRTEAIAAEFQPRIPFGLVAVEVPSLSTRLFRYPDLTAKHLQATCSIPLFLPTVRIGNRRFLDGGFFEKLPIWAAVEMGATRIIAVDSLPDVGLWWLRAGIDIARLFKPRRGPIPGGIELILISNSEPLGVARDAVFWKRDNIARWLDLGYRDAARALRAVL